MLTYYLLDSHFPNVVVKRNRVERQFESRVAVIEASSELSFRLRKGNRNIYRDEKDKCDKFWAPSGTEHPPIHSNPVNYS